MGKKKEIKKIEKVSMRYIILCKTQKQCSKYQEELFEKSYTWASRNDKLLIFTDGGARNNPGPAGIGVVIYNRNHKLLKKLRKFIGIATNNQAEYQAVILALETVISEYQSQEIEFYLDSHWIVLPQPHVARVCCLLVEAQVQVPLVV